MSTLDHPIKIDKALVDRIRAVAAAERRTIRGQLEIIIELGLERVTEPEATE